MLQTADYSDAQLCEVQRIQALVLLMPYHIDMRDWPKMQGLFADQVDVDHRSISGEEPATISREELGARWQRGLETFSATQHLAGCPLVDLESTMEAGAKMHFQAQYFVRSAGAELKYTLGGLYDMRVVRTPAGWRISALTIKKVWDWGDRRLIEEAVARGVPVVR